MITFKYLKTVKKKERNGVEKWIPSLLFLKRLIKLNYFKLLAAIIEFDMLGYV